ncbi:hypothetical protein Bbelb_134820 [Branchiostoma belcheri]|nr:hypothetical protein Bbelb_134820 [Branchiostoma belcheri]
MTRNFCDGPSIAVPSRSGPAASGFFRVSVQVCSCCRLATVEGGRRRRHRGSSLTHRGVTRPCPSAQPTNPPSLPPIKHVSEPSQLSRGRERLRESTSRCPLVSDLTTARSDQPTIPMFFSCSICTW